MTGDRVHPRELVRLLNGKLASTRSVIVKTAGKRKARGVCQLRDTASGEIRYLSLSEVENLARSMGLLPD